MKYEKVTNESIDKYITDNNLPYKRIEDLKSAKIPIDYKCNDCGHVRKIQWRSIKGKVKCSKCKDRFWYTDDKVDDLIREQNLPVIRIGHVINQLTLLEWECTDCHHKWNTSSRRIFRDKKYCKLCRPETEKKPHIINGIITDESIDLELIKTKKPIKRISHYINQREKLIWECTKETCKYQWPALHRNIFRLNTGCPRCVGFVIKTNDEMDLYLIENDVPIKRIGNIISSKEPIDCECTICSKIIKLTYKQMTACVGHKECTRKRSQDWKRWTDQRIDDVMIAEHRSIKRVSHVITGSKDVMTWFCEDCEQEFTGILEHVIYRRDGCSVCRLSRGAQRIRSHLIKTGYVCVKSVEDGLKLNQKFFIMEYKFPNCKYKRPLPFDFAVFDAEGNLLFLIEYDGEQHFRPSPNISGHNLKKEIQEEHFKNIQRNDKIKTDFCDDPKNPYLIRTSYKNFYSLESYLDEQIKNYLQSPRGSLEQKSVS